MSLSFVTNIKNNFDVLKSSNQTVLNLFYNLKHRAFSLVEMLMALLVASLLLAALAPVMTRRMADHELKVLSEAANYDKDTVVSIFTEDTKFNIPQDVNQIRMTLMGGGGSGGNALYGNKTFTNSGTFTVPEGVTKLRVFMIGGGGSGASGGGSGTAYGNIGGSAGQQEYAGNTAANTGVKTWNIPSSAKGNTPAVDAKCILSGVNKWTLVSDTAKTVEPKSTIVNVKACGGGGGGSAYGQGGNSGGYVDKQVIIPQNMNSVSITIGGGGGGGGPQDMRWSTSAAGWGGGGGGSESMNTTLIYPSGIAPGGNGGTYYWNCRPPATYIFPTNATGVYSKIMDNITITAGSGNSSPLLCSGTDGAATTSGHGSLEGGGGGGGGSTCGGGGGGGAATFFGNYANSETTDKDFFLVAPGGGGGGGGYTQCGVSGGGGGGAGGGDGGRGATPDTPLPSVGKAAMGGNTGALLEEGANRQSPPSTSGAGGASPVGNPSYCAGGKIGNWTTAGASGKNGYMLISWAPQTDALKCDYNITSNGGGGGGAGQITVNEINVTPKETLFFEVGGGGTKQTSIASNGNAGKTSYIRRGGLITSPAIISASGGYGGEFSSSETSPSQGAPSRNPNIGTNWTGVDYKAKVSLAQGSDGYLKTDVSSSGYGGAGGSSQNIKGETLSGGIGGNSIKNGGEPDITNYGAGGGGGSGGLTDNEEFGTGGAGASGYIYIEWGGTNGGGGTIGEIVKKVITNLDNDSSKRVMDIKIGKGGLNSNGETTSVSVLSGGKTVKLEAKGGLKGKDGTMDINKHGGETNIPDNFSDLYKEYVQSNLTIAKGQKGTDEYGGTGGYLSCLFYTKDEEGNNICASSVKANDGINNQIGPIRSGCGGSSIPSPLYESICNAKSVSASPDGGNGTFGAGGGGGAVLNKIEGKGGNGGDGFVILEYKSTILD